MCKITPEAINPTISNQSFFANNRGNKIKAKWNSISGDKTEKTFN